MRLLQRQPKYIDPDAVGVWTCIVQPMRGAHDVCGESGRLAHFKHVYSARAGFGVRDAGISHVVWVAQRRGHVNKD